MKQKIKDRGLKISWIAKKVGVSQPLLSMYLNGSRTMPEDIERKIKEILK
jgi:predicted transcriptional regulator